MNKFIYPFAAAAALFTGNLFAQEAALSSAQNDAPTSLFDCFVKVEEHNRTLGFEGAVVTQEFTACTTGQLQETQITVKGATDG
ncbi:MAG TPA: hypothetical protein DCS71_05005, partial [Flavobacteriales bacterium]|nr:hypothetical protein [Flavobacteriales bacterium]